ncbi:hypothetical protein [Nocardioides sp. YR527]|uniref:hypothetical protein n=1 Tax=Nocardioides sp. YR527 TaxID=1881028 RepID=UPI00115FE7FE|nr:hypothetical protein [Nocardioides sp. YR527]
MSHATNGRAREHRVSDHMTRRRWIQVARSAGSKGAADLIMVHPVFGLALVQVGTEKSKKLGPADRDRLVTLADLCSALPLVALCAQGRTPRFLQATRDVPSTWDEVTV